MRYWATDRSRTRRNRWWAITPLIVIVGAGLALGGGVADADPGGTVQASVVDVHGAPVDGVCVQIIVPDNKNTADVVVTTTAPSGTDGTPGHITQANVPVGSYIGRYINCGSSTSFASFYTGGTYNKAKARPFGVTAGAVTHLGQQQLLAFGTTGSISGTVVDGSRPGGTVPSLTARAYTATGNSLLEETCTGSTGQYVFFDLPDSGAGIKLDFGKGTCANDENFVSAWYEGTTYANSTPIAIVPNGDAHANDMTLALVTKPKVTATSVSFGGDAANVVITVQGSGFGRTAPAPDPVDRPCGEPDVSGSGYDYGNNVVFWDLGDSAGWQAGFPGDCIGLNFVSYSATQIVFTLNDWYRDQSNGARLVAVGDPFTLRIKGAPITGVINSIG